MPIQPKRATIYFDPDLHYALKIKSAETNHSISDLVNSAVKLLLVEELDDLKAFEDRADEPSYPFEEVLKKLKTNGKI